ncbi:transketolase [candidate division TA06 bacterium DG_24]|jgi:transketolase|uniref:Transketolase n=2 Tax=Bacteria division TA06 TaxID=1156500 RepID=A0A0S8G933_UNCT6|nr:MAG: transketolase [candidate division TA06 bacterium DG_24]KPK69225.1 MAG: transketolase [candidate division TA06 bacterium SM23_40]
MGLSHQEVEELQEIARQLRIDIVEMLAKAGSGHTGGSMSMVEILVALYFRHMRHRPHEPCWPDRDRLVLSKGHGAPALYAVLARAGYFPREELSRLRVLGSILQGHPDMAKTPGIDFSSGSIGQGLSAACGMALAARLDKKDLRVYSVLGDGDMQEGQTWEAAMAAAHYGLGNLSAIVDYNRVQSDGPVEEVMEISPLAAKWQAFGWRMMEIDGHNLADVSDALEWTSGKAESPSVVIAHTIKGKGLSFAEGKASYHGVAPSKAELEQARKELAPKRERVVR